MAAMHLGDMGADVIKVEHPTRPDPARGHGPSKDGQNLWWKTLGRNKRDDHARPAHRRRARGAAAAGRDRRRRHRELPARARSSAGASGTTRCPRATRGLVLARVTGFGQIGSVPVAPGIRHARRGDERVRRDDGRAGRAARPAAVRSRRRHRVARDGVRDHGRAARARAHAASARRSTWRSSSRSSRCSGRRSRAGTSSARCSRARATARRTTPRATPTAPPTARGSRCRRAPSRSPSG